MQTSAGVFKAFFFWSLCKMSSDRKLASRRQFQKSETLAVKMEPKSEPLDNENKSLGPSESIFTSRIRKRNWDPARYKLRF